MAFCGPVRRTSTPHSSNLSSTPPVAQTPSRMKSSGRPRRISTYASTGASVPVEVSTWLTVTAA